MIQQGIAGLGLVLLHADEQQQGFDKVVHMRTTLYWIFDKVDGLIDAYAVGGIYGQSIVVRELTIILH